MSLTDYFATGPACERPVFEAVWAHLSSVGEDVYVEAVSVGLLIKRSRTFAELRPGRDRVVLSLLLNRAVADPRISRRVRASGSRVAHFVPLRSATEVDAEVREWLTESYLDSPP